ncbi:MAG: hypothetical protein ACRDGV_05920 [Candidatus Limnocylindria bacterium]
MERLVYRSTSLIDLQAELHRQDLLEEARRRHVHAPIRRQGRRQLGISLPWLRQSRR